MEKETLTVRDIAKMAQVSVATVSRVLNDSASVKPETKQKVQEVIDRYGFKPNAIARSLFHKKTKALGCIMPDVNSQFFARIVSELEKKCFEAGYSLFLCNALNDFDMESFYLESLVERQVDGIFFLGGRANETQLNMKYLFETRDIAAQMPFVAVNGKMNIDNVYSVCTDEVDAMEQIVHYLYDKGHQSMGLIGGNPSVSVAVDKMNYFRDLIVNQYPIDYQKSFTAFGGFNAVSGYEAFMETYKNGELPSVIIGMNDEVAIGILRACFELGIQVPEQLSIFGYDNTFVSAMVYPSLSTFSHDYNQLADKAVEVMIKLIEGDQSLEKEYLIKGELILRESAK